MDAVDSSASTWTSAKQKDTLAGADEPHSRARRASFFLFFVISKRCDHDCGLRRCIKFDTSEHAALGFYRRTADGGAGALANDGIGASGSGHITSCLAPERSSWWPSVAAADCDPGRLVGLRVYRLLCPVEFGIIETQVKHVRQLSLSYAFQISGLC